MRRWYVVADRPATGPDWAMPYESVVAQRAPIAVGRRGAASGDDLLLLYTGGTTGMPKGVMWRQDDLFNVLGARRQRAARHRAGRRRRAGGAARPGDARARDAVGVPAHARHRPVLVARLDEPRRLRRDAADRKFDVGRAVADEVERDEGRRIIIVGQAFAGPMLEELDAEPGRYDLSSAALISSSGVMWSQENKDGLLGHMPERHPVRLVRLVRGGRPRRLGVARRARPRRRPSSCSGERVAVFTEDGRRVQPGSGEQGMVAVTGFIPVGYYKDEAKTAATFRTFEGKRWSVPGDWAEVNADGTLHLLGRGSVCINTGGEKVFPEEVEEALKTAPGGARRRVRRRARRALRRGHLRGGRAVGLGRRHRRRRGPPT